MSLSSFNTEDELIKDMYETVLNHNGDWKKAKTTHLVCKIYGDNAPIIITNSSDEHAEELLIDALKENSNVKKTKKTTDSAGPESDFAKTTEKLGKMSINQVKTEVLKITIYIYNSPCSKSEAKKPRENNHDCSQNLITFLNDHLRVCMRLYVTNLYNIRRESCKSEWHYAGVSPEDHEANYRGLRKLMRHDRCEIKEFSKDVWNELLNFVTVSDKCKKKLLREYGNKIDRNDRSREDEDRRIQEDLDHIRNNEL